MVIGLLLYTAIYVPVKVAFIEESTTAVFLFELMVDILFLTDVALTFFTAIYDKHGTLLVDKKQISAKYIKGWFFIDFATSIPTQVLELIFAKSLEARVNAKILRLLRIPRIFKLLRLTKIMNLDIFDMIGEF
jgi:hypothetical protein